MRTTLLRISIPATLLALTLQGCGGGGGGGGGSSSSTVSYSGITAEAQIDADNANTLALSALAGVATSSTASAVGVETGTETSGAIPATTSIVDSMTALASRNLVKNGQTIVPGTTIDPQTENCSGGGSLTVSGEVDNNSGALTADVTLSGCVESGETMDGKVHLTGTIDLYTAEYSGPLNFKMQNLRVRSSTSNELDVTTAGTMTCTFSSGYSNDSDCILNLMDVRDNQQGKTIRYQNLRITQTGTSETLTGRVYYPDYGYVDVSTSSALVYYGYDYWPSMGELKLNGKNGSASTLTVIDNTQYTLSVDADGDSIFEVSNTHNWP